MTAIRTVLQFFIRVISFGRWQRARRHAPVYSFQMTEVGDQVRIVFTRRPTDIMPATALAVSEPARGTDPKHRGYRWPFWRRGLHRPMLHVSPGIAAAVIPAHNEEAIIAATLRSVLQNFSAQDIFVFCDNCSDDTALIARQFLPEENVLLSDGQYGKSRGLEHVFKSIIFPRNYVYVSVVDADTTLEPGFLVQSLKALQFKDVACTVGQVKSRWYPRNVISVYRTYVYTLWQLIYKRLQSATNTITIASGCSSTWKTRVLRQLDFDHRMSTEDFSLTIQAHRKRLGKIKYVPAAVVWTQDPFTVASYRKQMYRWDRAWWESVRKYRVGISWFHFRHGLPVGMSALDISTLLLSVDMFLFIASVLLLPLMLLHPVDFHVGFLHLQSRSAVLHSLMWQYLSVLGSALFVALMTRRPRVFLYSPLFLLLMYLDILLTVQTILSTARRQYRAVPTLGALASVWISPERRKEA